MTQLTGDPDNMPNVDVIAARIISKYSSLQKHETIFTRNATHRILATDIFSPVSLPPFNNSAVDGYAICFDNYQGNMSISARITAGDSLSHYDVKTAIRIFTGAALPDGFDTVYMQEDVTVENHHVKLPTGLKKGDNTRLMGEDIELNQLALNKGVLLDARHIALLAALGIENVLVSKPLTIGLFSTGNEIINPDQPLHNSKIFDANRYLLASLLHHHIILDLGILPDNANTIKEALSNAANQCDLILTSGGVSTGEEDHVKKAIDLDFWKISIKPGRPVAIGKVKNTPFIGLPGNPVAVFVTFNYVVKPLIAALQGALYSPPQSYPVILGFNYKKKSGRREYVRVSLVNNIAYKYLQDGAGVITSLTKTDGLIELEEDRTDILKGETAGFIPYRSLT